MIVYISTVKRKRPVREGGELVKLCWDTKEVLNVIPIYPTDPDIVEDPNPRGNSRGGKGILVRDNEVSLGTYHSVLVYDRQTLRLKRKITHDLFVGVHELYSEGDDIWVSSTAIDCALKVDMKGSLISSWWPREEKLLQDKFGLVPLEINKNIDNRLRFLHEKMSTKESHTHLNCVTGLNDEVYILLNSLGVLARIEPEFRIVVHDKRLIGAHSAKIIKNGQNAIVCGSFSSSVLIYDLATGRLVDQVALQAFPEVKGLSEKFPDQPFNKTVFVRGLEMINENRILVGISPASVLEIDLEKKKLRDIFRYSDDVGDAIHGLGHSND